MMQDPNAVDVVETFGRKRQLENIRLQEGGLPFGKVLRGHFTGEAKVDAHHMRAPAARDFCEAPHSASHVKHELSSQILRSETGTANKRLFRTATHGIVHLRTRIQLPLKPKAAGIVLRIDKAQ